MSNIEQYMKTLFGYTFKDDDYNFIKKEFNEKDKQLDKYKNVIDKIKEYIKERTEFGEYTHAYPGVLNQDEVRKINKLLEEVE